jgi:hypothetical protein
MNRTASGIVIISTLLSASYSDTEPNDTFGQATAIAVNTTADGSLGTTDPDDWYQIDLPHDGALRVVVTPGGALNTHVKLFDQDGATSLNFNGGAYGNQGSFGEPDTGYRIDLKSGTYYVTIARWGSDGGQGTYTINTAFTPTEYPNHNDSEPNDSSSTAMTLIVNASDTGHLGYYKDGATDRDDWYRIELPHDGALRVVVVPGHALNTQVKLFDQDGTTSLNFNGGAYGNQGSSGEPDSVFRADLKSGTYYVTASGWIGSGQGSYIITTDFTPTEYPDHNDTEPNDSSSTAMTLYVNAPDTGHLGYYKDGATDRDDWYRIELPYDGPLRVVVIPGNALNTQVKLFDQDGTTSLNFNGGAYGNQGSFGEPDSAYLTDLKSGTYYITVSGWHGSGQGSYVLKASAGRDYNYSTSIDPQVAHANLDTVRIRFNNRLIDSFKTCLNIGVISNENNQRFATYACLDNYMWIEQDSVLTIRFDHFSSLGSDTGLRYYLFSLVSWWHCYTKEISVTA